MKSVLLKCRNYLLNDGIDSRLFHILAYVLSFIVPFSLAIMLFKANNYYPFVKDGQTLMMVDMSGQYIAFFRYYRSLLNFEVDIFYTLGKATGGEFLSIFLYYLASPFNIITSFFSVSELPKALLWIVIFKIGASGLASYIAFSKTNNNSYKNLIFSFSYALMAYSFVYFSNIMWLDGLYLLPLVALGIIKITKDESPLLYIISLAMMIISSWYIGIMVALFSVLFFFVQFNHHFRSWRKDLRRIYFFAGGSLIASLISFAFWFTAFLTILGTKGGSSFTNLPETITEFNDFVSIQKGFFANTFNGFSDISGTSTTVSFYVGIIPFVLTVLYFFKNDVNYQQKAGVLLLFIIYIFAFNNVGLNDLFHGGPRPNWFPGRYTFIFGFLLTFYGAQSFANVKALHWSGFFLPPIIAAIVFSLIKNDTFTFQDSAYFYFIIIYLLLIMYFIIAKFLLPHEKLKEIRGVTLTFKITSPIIIAALTFVALLNVYGNNNHILSTYTGENSRHDLYDIYLEDEALADTINYIKAQDTSLYRLEKSFIRKGTYNNADNDALYYGYNGISHYSSNEKKSTLSYLKKLGFHYNGFNLNYANGSTLAINSYLGVKYFINNGLNRNFDLDRYLNELVIPNSEYSTTENEYVLPFLIATTKQNASFVGDGYYINANEIYWFDRFEYQNNLFKHLSNTVTDESGERKDIFKRATVTKTLVNIEPLETANNYKVEESGQIRYRVSLDEGFNYYYYFNASSKDHEVAPTIRLRENNRNLTYFSYHGHQINGLRNDHPSATLEVIVTGETNKVEIKEEIYYEDLSVLAEYVEAIKNAAVVTELSQLKTSKYRAKLVTNTNEQQMLLTIPYDKNLKIYLNGRRVETTTNFNIYTGFIVPNAGEHEVIIKYVQPSFQVGLPLGIFVLGATIFSHFKFSFLFKKEDEDKENELN